MRTCACGPISADVAQLRCACSIAGGADWRLRGVMLGPTSAVFSAAFVEVALMWVLGLAPPDSFPTPGAPQRSSASAIHVHPSVHRAGSNLCHLVALLPRLLSTRGHIQLTGKEPELGRNSDNFSDERDDSLS